MSLPELLCCEVVGWIKTAALLKALDSVLLEAIASYPLPHCIFGWFAAPSLERSGAGCVLPLCGTVWPRKGRACARAGTSPPPGGTSAPHPPAGRKGTALLPGDVYQCLHVILGK